MNNYNAYQRLVRTASERSRFVSKTLNMGDIETTEQAAQHRDLMPSQIKRSEDQVSKATDAINGFMNPFAEENETLYCISSGTTVPSEVEDDIMNVELIGVKAK